MDQEGNSTASFGSSSNMATSETANAAMVCQTVASDMMSSVGESPAKSSESALEMFPKRSTQRGIGQEQNVDGYARGCLCHILRVSLQLEPDLDRQLQDRPKMDVNNQVGHQYQVPQVKVQQSATFLEDLHQKVEQVSTLRLKIWPELKKN